MAIATLAACFGNPKVFSGVVKIRKGLAARLLLTSRSLSSVHRWFVTFATSIQRRCPPHDASRQTIDKAVAAIVALRL